MTVRLAFAREGEAADLAAFLGRLIRWDKAAVVRLRSAEGEPVLGVFGHPPFGGVLAVRTAALGGPDAGVAVDATVSAGQLLDAVDAIEAAVPVSAADPTGTAPDSRTGTESGTGSASGAGTFAVPASVTGPSWAGVLPPRSGWRRVGELEAAAVRGAAAATVTEFRTRTESLEPAGRTRAGLDALAEELWTRPLGEAGLTLRVVHAAHALGFLRGDDPVALLSAGPWLRLRTGYGSVALRRAASPGAGLTVFPT